MAENAKLQKFRDTVLDLNTRNFLEISKAKGFTDKENAGSLLLVAQAAIGAAAGAIAKTDPELAKLSANRQVIDVLNLLIEIHQKPTRPNLSVVKENDHGGRFPELAADAEASQEVVKALAAERDALQAELDAAARITAEKDRQNQELREEVERLREAMEPFSELLVEDDADFPDNTRVVVEFGRTTVFTLKLGDLRRAAKIGGA